MRSTTWRFVATLTACAALVGCGGDAPSTLDAPGPDATCGDVAARAALDVPYQALPGVAPDLQALDIYPPCSGSQPAPVVVWVHGGAWAIGDKRAQITDKVALFTAAGYLLVSINYRLSPDTPDLDPARVMHPRHVEDAAAAVAWVHDHIAGYGGDPARLVLLGHSAGAHLVALLGTDPAWLGAHGLPLATLAGVGSFDTEAYDIPTTMQTASAMQALILRNAFGDDPAVWAMASPLNHVVAGQGIPPFLVVERGEPGRRQTEAAFAQRLRDVGGASTVIDAGGLTHEEVNASIGAAGDTVMTAPVMAFLAACFR
ncbi:MAG: alpha/beta hydrolase [Kofleriaceae bacterium]